MLNILLPSVFLTMDNFQISQKSSFQLITLYRYPVKKRIEILMDRIVKENEEERMTFR